MTIELYPTSHSTCSQKVRLIWLRKACPNVTKIRCVARRRSSTNLNNSLQTISSVKSNGVVPAWFTTDGPSIRIVSPCSNIVKEIIPETSLVPDDSIGRAKMRRLDAIMTLTRLPYGRGLRVPTCGEHHCTNALIAKTRRTPISRKSCRPACRLSQSRLWDQTDRHKSGVWHGRNRIFGVVSNKSRQTTERIDKSCWRRSRRTLDRCGISILLMRRNSRIDAPSDRSHGRLEDDG